MDNKQADLNSDIKPITELGNGQSVPSQEKAQIPPASPPTTSVPPQTPPIAPPPPPDYVPPQAPSSAPGYTPTQQKISVAPPPGKEIGQGAAQRLYPAGAAQAPSRGQDSARGRVQAGLYPAGAAQRVQAGLYPAGAIIRRGGERLWTIVIVLVLTILLLAATFFLFFYRATINIAPTPAANTITLDGKQVSPGKFKVMPGPHSLVVKKTGYISLNLNRDFKINQKLDLSRLELKKALTPEIVVTGASRPTLSGNRQQVNFMSSDGHLETLPVLKQGKVFEITPLSVGTYPTIRELIYGQDNSFAFVLDAQALKIIDFKKTNLVDQQEAILPPDPSKIHSFTTNALQNDAFGQPNSQIVYDFKTDTDWFLYLADRDHKQSQILMQIDPKVFTSMSLDWGQNTRQILLLGGTAGIYDLPTRNFERISDETGFVSGSWGPQGNYAAAIKSDGGLYVLKNSNLEDTKISVQNGALSWVSPNELVALTDQGAVKINFDSGAVINYAEIAGLQNSSFIAVSGNSIFFSDAEGLKTATLKENFYGV